MFRVRIQLMTSENYLTLYRREIVKGTGIL